jgi:hypothetical protein
VAKGLSTLYLVFSAVGSHVRAGSAATARRRETEPDLLGPRIASDLDQRRGSPNHSSHDTDRYPTW